MLDHTTQTRQAHRQRVNAEAIVQFDVHAGRTRLTRLRQQGHAKAMLPKVHRPDPEVVFLNTAGGLTAGDRITFNVALAPGARAVATTQTAERGYASLPHQSPARMNVRLDLGDGAHLDWLPQETILFDQASLHRSTHIDLTGSASCLWCETVILGRAAMGETVRRLTFHDERRIVRDGVPVMVEPLRLTEAELSAQGAALLRGATAMSTIALVAPDAPDRAAAIAPLIAHPDVHAAVSGWDGKLVVRALSPTPHLLRRWMQPLLETLRGGPLPRVWTI